MVSLKRGCICLPKLSATLKCIVFKRLHRNYTKTVDAMLNKRLTLKEDPAIKHCNTFSRRTIKIQDNNQAVYNTDVWNVQIELKYRQAKPPFIFTE